MVDLSRPQSGSFGPGLWFSDLFVAALQGRFTGGILIRTGSGDRALFFRDGDPVHAAGAGFSSHFLGQVVVELALAPASSVLEAIEHQRAIPPEEQPLLGEVLTIKLGLSPEAILKALRLQCEARFASCFGLGDGTFQSAPGENDRIRARATPVEGWPILFRGLTEHGSDVELREAADRLLGRSVKMKGSLAQIEALVPLDEETRTAFRYLDRPRRPDQLERALRRRRARGIIRMLELLELLELHPAARAVHFPKGGLSRGGPAESRPDEAPIALAKEPVADRRQDGPPTRPNERIRVRDSVPPKRSRSVARGRLTARIQLFDEIDRFHARLHELDHFGVLGVSRTDPQPVLRKRYTDLAKRFHPDAFSGSEVPAPIAEKVREISARVNEAYHVLASEDTRREYEALLADGRIQADGRRPDPKKEADLKVKMALVHLKRREHEKATVLLEEAVQLDPDRKIYRAHLEWSKLADPHVDRQSALDHALPILQEAVKAHREDPTMHFYLGRLLRELGEPRKALEHFKVAQRLDPKYADAAREARLTTMRLEKSKTTGMTDVRGALSRFFKR